MIPATDWFPTNANEALDNDKDGVGDNTDTDDDNDGLTDVFEQINKRPSETGDYDGNGTSGESPNANGTYEYWAKSSPFLKDTDNDGVTDDKDTCANTPSGQAVNANGCATSQLDNDNDGVSDDKDTCANTPRSESVDTDGCSDSQKDDDNDGLSNDKDQCPDTLSGQTVNEVGCSAVQVLSVADEKLDKSIKFYPNPVSNVLSIKSESILIEKIEIYTVLGVKIMAYDTGFERIQTAHLAKGMYIIKIYSEKGTATRRLIKQ
jgi:hypothetical protein